MFAGFRWEIGRHLVTARNAVGLVGAISVLFGGLGSLAAQELLPLSIYKLDVATGKSQLLVKEPRAGLDNCGSPSWSADGKQVLFDATPGRSWAETHIFSCKSMGDADKVPTDFGVGNCPTWSPDGKRIAFLLNPGALPGVESGVWLMAGDGGNRRRLGSYGIPRWSPEGSRLLVASFSNPCRISLLDPDTGNEQGVTIDGYELLSAPTWAGDDETIVGIVRGAAGVSVALVTIDESGEGKVKRALWSRRLPSEPSPTISTVFCAETGQCFFIGKLPEGAAVFSIEAKAGATLKRVEERTHHRLASLAVSADGKQILYCSDEPARAAKPEAENPKQK